MIRPQGPRPRVQVVRRRTAAAGRPRLARLASSAWEQRGRQIIRLRLVLPAASAAVAALGIVVAPLAGADDRTCTSSGSSTVCTRPGGSTAITATPPVVGPYNDCGFGLGMEYMCDGGVTWNIGGIFRNRN